MTEAEIITSFEALEDDVIMTDAWGGCYINRNDFAKRERLPEGTYRMFDHDDESVTEHGPLWQYASQEMVERIAAHFNKVTI